MFFIGYIFKILFCPLVQSMPKAFVRDYMVEEKCKGKATLRTKSGETVRSWTVSMIGVVLLMAGWILPHQITFVLEMY